jgi:hypothetical protein
MASAPDRIGPLKDAYVDLLKLALTGLTEARPTAFVPGRPDPVTLSDSQLRARLGGTRPWTAYFLAIEGRLVTDVMESEEVSECDSQRLRQWKRSSETHASAFGAIRTPASDSRTCLSMDSRWRAHC